MLPFGPGPLTPSGIPAHAVVVYAWNENNEGGWLLSTLGEGTARIDTLAAAIERRQP